MRPFYAFNLRTMFAVFLLSANAPAADSPEFTSSNSETARLTVEVIRSRHFENQPVDDNVSAELVRSYVRYWDAGKLYFRSSDISEFEAFNHVLDDHLAEGKIDFAKLVYDRYLLRQQELQDTIGQLIDTGHDFSLDESLSTDSDSRKWAATDSELKERWRKRIKSQLLTLTLEGETAEDARLKLHRRYANNLLLARQTTGSELLEVYLSTFMRCFDPHSSFMSPRSVEEFDINMRLQLQGIGARLKHEDGDTVVVEVVPGGAAAADGRLQKDDRIIGVAEGSDGNFVDVVGLKLDRVVDRIRGKAGTNVRLKVNKSTGETTEIEMTRQVVKLDDGSVKGTVLDAQSWIDGADAKIGVLSIPSFYRDFRGATSGTDFRSTSRDVKRVLSSFRANDVDAVVVDLRYNSGGSLTEAVDVSGLFISEGPVVQTMARDDQPRVLSDSDQQIHWSGPMVVLCNRLSASASEIFAGAMRDYRRGIIVGDSTTHGKGTVQTIMGFPRGLGLFSEDRGDLKLTIGMWYRVNGESGQIAGVPADIQLPSLLDVLEKGEKELPNVIEFTKTTPAEFAPYEKFLPDAVLDTLRRKSSARVENDDHFSALQQRIDFIRSQQEKNSISLNESEAKAQRLRLKQLSTDDETAANDSNDDSPGRFRDSFYNREVLRITIDYVGLLNSKA